MDEEKRETHISQPPDEKEIPPDNQLEGSNVDDELWDPGSGAENIPLFEEFASELIEQDEKKTEQIIEPEADGKTLLEEPTEEVIEPGLEAKGFVHSIEGPATIGPDKKDGETTDEGIKKIDIGTQNKWLLWGMAAFSSVLIAIGTATIWKMTGGNAEAPFIAHPTSQSKGTTTAALGGENTKRSAVSHENVEGGPAGQAGRPLSPMKPLTVTLASFLIPAQQNGQMVFFNLQAELSVKDKKTMDELMQKEVWIRDIIYRELKGIDITNGFRGDILDPYQKTIVERINTELAPLKVEDVKLSGSPVS
ncbi:MAG: hypothetical protein ACP5SG_09315 [Dissulfurimicrobium sp.]|uniref:hypothetical protein n=1 Tax=Dissulfurimicrobium sp. TaxID=2022436 RepID=UPI003D0FFBE1